MSMLRLVAISVFVCACIWAQTTTATVQGTVTDPGDAAVPNAAVELKNTQTGAVRTATSGSDGVFRFNSVPPASYTLSIAPSSGFKALTLREINLNANEVRELGRLKLALGAVTEEVQVKAAATPVQTASSEKSSLINTDQINMITLRGRDLFGFLNLIPGVTGASGGETTGTGLPGTINGGGTKAFSVDGMIDMDEGSNGTVHFEPNVDAIAEIKVMTTNFQAEYGHNTSGQINVVTKGGGQSFHGAAYEGHRHEMFNAKGFFENFNGTSKSIYRYDVYGWALGGPVYIPKVWNTDKRRVFFQASQEYTKQRPSTSYNYYQFATAAERRGDFSNSRDQNGNLLVIRDPTTRAPVPNNDISGLILDQASAAYGQAVLNFFPLPNCDPAGGNPGCGDASKKWQRNYYYAFTGPHPRRNDVVRLDFNLTSKLTSWVRYANDYDLQDTSSNVPLKNAAGQFVPYHEQHPNPGHGTGVAVTYTISPTMVNEFTFGKSYNTWSWYVDDPSVVDRARLTPAGMPPIPSWNDFSKDPNYVSDNNLPRPDLGPGAQNFAPYIPALSFSGGSAVVTNFSTSRPYTNWNDIYQFSDNLSWVRGKHNLKFGYYHERSGKVQQSGNGLGSYNFGSSSAFPQDTNDGYANAFLGNMQVYSEGKRVVGDFWLTTIAWFAQDNWRVSPRVTLDLGIRFYHNPPYENLNLNTTEFVRSTYDPTVIPRLYYPGCKITPAPGAACSSSNQIAVDLKTGFQTFPALVGTFVPYAVGGYGSQPNYFNGYQLADGKNPNLPLRLWTNGWAVPAPRIGIAWDVFGNGKTAVRGGFGVFYNSIDGNQIFNYAGGPPVSFTRTIYYSTINSVPSYANTAAVSPAGGGYRTGNQPLQALYNSSFGIQQSLGFGTVIEVSWVGSFIRHNQTGNLGGRQYNEVPMFSQYAAANLNPWFGNLAGNYSGRALNDNYFRPIQGLAALASNDYFLSSNYHALQVSVRRNMTRGLSYTLAYTFAKTTGYSAAVAGYFTDSYRNHGPSFAGAPQVLASSFVYEIPGLAKRLNFRPVGWVTDNWNLSGIYNWQSHGMIGVPGISFTNTSSSNPGFNFTGSSGNEPARMVVLGSPAVSNDQVTFTHTIDGTVLAPPTPCSAAYQSLACFGNAGSGSIIKVPTWVNNWDMTFSKNFPIGSEKRMLIFRAEMYNVFNHTQFTGINSTEQFPITAFQSYLAGGSLSALEAAQSNNQFGRYTSAAAPRRMVMSLRFQF